LRLRLTHHSHPNTRHLHSFPTRRSSDLALNGKATRRLVNLYLNKLSNPVELLIYYPNKPGRVPAFLGYNFWGNYTITNEKEVPLDRKSTRLNSSHVKSSYAVLCLKKKKE